MTAWTDLVSQTFKSGKSKKAGYSLKDAMKSAKKLYKKGGNKAPTVGGSEKVPTVGGTAEIPDSKMSAGDVVPHSVTTGLQGSPLKGGKSRKRKTAKRSKK